MSKNRTLKKDSKVGGTSVSVDLNQHKGLNKILFWSLTIFGFILYSPTIKYGFVLDDIAVIQNNRFVQEGFSGIPDLFTTFYWKGFTDVNAGLYRPLSMIMFAIEWAISPDNPVIHHFINVILYAFTIGLLFKVLNKLFSNHSIWVSFAIALFFMLHPSHTEVVANIKSRDEILCFFFFLLTFQQLIKVEGSTISKHLKVGLFFLACLLSKEAGIMYLPIFALYFFLFKQVKFPTLLKQLMPLIIVAVGWLVLHQTVIHSDPFSPVPYDYQDNSLVLCESGSRYATGIGILGKYIFETLIPSHFSYDYSYNEIPCLSFTTLPVIFTLVFIVGAIFLFIKTRKKQPEIAFGVAFFFISILLVTNVFLLIGTTYANRLLYAPSLGLIIVVVIGLFTVFKSQQKESLKLLGILFSVIVGLIFTVQTIQRYKVWESNEILFVADVKNSPNSSRVHFNNGVIQMNALTSDSIAMHQKYKSAISSFKKAIKIDSTHAGANTNLGVVYFRLNKYKESIFYTQRAIKLNPDDTSLYGNLGDAYFALGSFEEAASAFKVIVKSKEATVVNYKRYGTALFNLKKYELASEVFKDGLEKFPNDTEIEINLGNAYGASGQVEKAISVFEKLFRENPSNMNVLRFLIMCYTELGNQEKVEQYSTYLR